MTTETSSDRSSSLSRTSKTFKGSQSVGYVLRVGDIKSCFSELFSTSGSATLQLVSVLSSPVGLQGPISTK